MLIKILLVEIISIKPSGTFKKKKKRLKSIINRKTYAFGFHGKLSLTFDT